MNGRCEDCIYPDPGKASLPFNRGLGDSAGGVRYAQAPMDLKPAYTRSIRFRQGRISCLCTEWRWCDGVEVLVPGPWLRASLAHPPSGCDLRYARWERRLLEAHSQVIASTVQKAIPLAGICKGMSTVICMAMHSRTNRHPSATPFLTWSRRRQIPHSAAHMLDM